MTDSPTISSLNHRHLLGLSTYSADEIRLILHTARHFREVLERPIKRVPTLRGVTVCNLFFEASTRTRISFELAEKRLSADVVNFSSSGSSVSKGESLKDTARNIEAMKVDVAVIRHRSPGAAHYLTRCVDAVVLNAGDGAHEHPTQALLDMLTMSDVVESFDGLNVPASAGPVDLQCRRDPAYSPHGTPLPRGTRTAHQTGAHTPRGDGVQPLFRSIDAHSDLF